MNDDSRKGAKDAKFRESSKFICFAPLASWRENLCWRLFLETLIGRAEPLLR